MTLQPAAIFHALGAKAVQLAARISPLLAPDNPKSYPSQRPCPACGEKMHYVASRTTALTGLYTRTCAECGYCDPKKVRMVRSL